MHKVSQNQLQHFNTRYELYLDVITFCKLSKKWLEDYYLPEWLKEAFCDHFIKNAFMNY